MQSDIIAALRILQSKSRVCKYLEHFNRNWIIYGGFIRYLATTMSRDGIESFQPEQSLTDPINYEKSISRIVHEMPSDIDIMIFGFENIAMIEKMSELKVDKFEKVSEFQTRYGTFHRWRIFEVTAIGSYSPKRVEFEISLCERYQDVYDFTVNTLAFNDTYDPPLFSSLIFNPTRMQFTVDEIIEHCANMKLIPLFNYDESTFESVSKRMKKLNVHGFQCTTTINDDTIKKNDSVDYKLALVIAQAMQMQRNYEPSWH